VAETRLEQGFLAENVPANDGSRNGTEINAVNGRPISYGNNRNNGDGPEGAPTGFFSPM